MTGAREFSRRVARSYDLSLESYVGRIAMGDDKRALLDGLIDGLPRRTRILDVACGPGLEASYLAERGYAVTGIDIASRVVAYAKAHARNAQFVSMDARELAFRDGSFGGIAWIAGLLCLRKSDAPVALLEARRVLKAGGRILVSTKLGTGEGWEFDERDDVEKYYAYYREGELANALRDAGFSVRACAAEHGDETTHPWIDALVQR